MSDTGEGRKRILKSVMIGMNKIIYKHGMTR